MAREIATACSKPRNDGARLQRRACPPRNDEEEWPRNDAFNVILNAVKNLSVRADVRLLCSPLDASHSSSMAECCDRDCHVGQKPPRNDVDAKKECRPEGRHSLLLHFSIITC